MREFFRKYFDLKLSLILAGFYLFTIALNLVKVFATAQLKETPLIPGKNFLFEVYLLDAVVVLFIMQLIAMHTKKLILHRTPWQKIVLLHVFIALFLGVIIQVITDLYRMQAGVFRTYDFKESLRIFLSVIDVNFLVYFAMLFIIYTYYYFKIIRANEVQQSQLEAQLITTKMNMLTTQLQPHFLFNTINCIIGLIDIDKKKAQNTLVDLSTLFREVTRNSHINLHTLEKELEILQHYLEILRVRFPENLEILLNINPVLLNKTVPTMLFQPLIENAINHGFERSEGQFQIKVSGAIESGYLVFTIENNGPSLQEKPTTSQTGVGLENLKQRLNTLFGDRATFTLRNKNNGNGVENIIEIPDLSTHQLTD